MRKPKIIRMFQKSKKSKGNEPLSLRSQARNEEMRSKGVESLCRKSDETVTGITSIDDMPGKDKKSTAFWKSRKQNAQLIVGTREIVENYSEFSPDVKEVLIEQDDDLDLISDSLSDMKNMAVAMNNELQYQAHLVEQVQGLTNDTSERTKRNANKIAMIK